MSDDGNAAVFVGTMLQTGDAVALCDECLIPWAVTILSAMTDTPPETIIGAFSTGAAPDDPPAGGEGEAAPPGPDGDLSTPRAGGRRGRTPPASPDPGTAADPDDGAAAVEPEPAPPAA